MIKRNAREPRAQQTPSKYFVLNVTLRGRGSAKITPKESGKLANEQGCLFLDKNPVARKIAQQVKMLTTKVDNMNSIPETSELHTHTMAYGSTYKHTYTNK